MLPPKLIALFSLCTLVCFSTARADFEIFGKGSVSKNYIASDSWTIDVNTSGGFAFTLFSTVRFEARYTNVSEFQNKLDIFSGSVVGTLSNMLTETDMVTAGLDIEFFGEKAAFQPFIYVGAGYIVTQRSYYFTAANDTSATFIAEPKQQGISGNLGAGIRLRIARRLAIELELFAYGMNIHQPNPLVNWLGTAGVRFFM